MTKLHELTHLGQAIWIDHIRRSFIASGELQELVDQGVRGVTSNPSIFEKAIAGSADYDAALRPLVDAGKSAAEIYEALVLADIQAAADILRPLFDRTSGRAGFVSLEVSPMLAHDAAGTVAEARRLYAALERPNVMIKVPATTEGIPAVTALIADGINVNVTLIFSTTQYEAVAEAYLSGVEQLAAKGGDPSQVASVASLFVSRVDTAVDAALERIGEQSLRGQIAVANAKAAYARFCALFNGARWEYLATQGARPQRPLWASTGTKNPAYSDTLYVDALIGADTVNTVPPATLRAFTDHGHPSLTLGQGLDEAQAQLAHLAELGINLDAITRQLLDDGVASFARSFKTLMVSIAEKRQKLLEGWQHMTTYLGEYQGTVDTVIGEIKEQRILERIWAHDHTVWAAEPIDITNRLGWLHVGETMVDNLDGLLSFVENVRTDGYNQALLLGMGGSSLAAELFRNTFGVKDGFLDLAVLDSTDPCAVLVHSERLDLSKTLFIVSTKSGGTVETLSFFKFYYNQVVETLGADQAGAHFVAITDPGSKLAELASRYKFRATFLNDPNIGGRYSALSYFGLVPAALVGVNLNVLLERALRMACNCESCNCPVTGDNNGARLGAVLGVLARARRDKMTIITSPAIAGSADWLEQLIAESTGKEGKGILPVVGEPLGTPQVYGDDRLFVYLQLGNSDGHEEPVQALEKAGYPVVRLRLNDLYDMGGQVFLWEMATAVASHLLGINPFDQPDVEAAKVLARRMVAEYAETGTLPDDKPTSLSREALTRFLAQAQPGDYVALQAFVEPGSDADVALAALRLRLRDRYRLATTVGYGPRFLHSTGQMHKGDAGNGMFIQLTSHSCRDVPIPDQAGLPTSSVAFGTLKMAQALGDKQALLAVGRRVISFHLETNVVGGLTRLMEMTE